MKQAWSKLTKGERIVSTILGLFIIISIIWCCYNPGTTEEEHNKSQSNVEEKTENESRDEDIYQVSEEEIQDERDKLEKYNNKVVYIGNGWNDVYDKDKVYEVEDVVRSVSGEAICYKIKGINYKCGATNKSQFNYYVEPLDTHGIYVYASLYNDDEIFGGTVHEDYNCFFLKKECLGSSLDVEEFDAGYLADSNEKYKHIEFCPLCSHYSDYYLNGDPK